MQGSSSGCLAAMTQHSTECTRLPGPLAGVQAPHTRRLTPWAPSSCLTHVAFLALSPPAETFAAGWLLSCVPGLPPTAPAQGKQPLSQDLQEAQRAPAWKSSEQQPGRRAFSREQEAAQPRAAQALFGWSRVRLKDGRAPALLRGPMWQSCWCEAALHWASLAQTCLTARLPSQEGAGSRGWETPLAPS